VKRLGTASHSGWIWRQGRNTQVIELMNETCDGPLKGDLSLAVFDAQVVLGNVCGQAGDLVTGTVQDSRNHTLVWKTIYRRPTCGQDLSLHLG
jgi:hypothetical protein